MYDNNLNISNRLTLREMWDSGYDISIKADGSRRPLVDMLDMAYQSRFEDLRVSTVYREENASILFSIMRGRRHLMQCGDWGFAWEDQKGLPFATPILQDAKRVYSQIRVDNACITKDVIMMDHFNNVLAVYRYVLSDSKKR
ncbi:MAG: hypothetical protein FWF56_01020 [Firmicutes bacterium]|nr:hypothetical protein [Bacillota bacterium]